MKRITVKAPSGQLKGRLFYPKRRVPSPAVLFLHGWTSAQSRYFDLAKKLARRGFVVMTVDLVGHGETGGDIARLTGKEYLADVVAVYDRIKREPRVDMRRIVVFGSSFGGYLATLLLGKRAPAGVILRAPANIRDEGFATRPHIDFTLRWDREAIPWHKRKLSRSGTRALRAINRFRGKMLIIEMGSDAVIPRQTIKNYINAVSDKKRLAHVVIKGAPHGSPTGAHKRTHDTALMRWLTTL